MAKNVLKTLLSTELKRIKRFYPKVLFRTLKTEVSHASGHQTNEQTELEI